MKITNSIKPESCCSSAQNTCCEPKTEPCCTKVEKILSIDFLYLDLDTCERCKTSDEALREALDSLSSVLDSLGYRVELKTVNISSRELAIEYRLVSSPTIRVNGIDICRELVESECVDCGDLCGDSVDCRAFIYKGEKYEQPPVSMIMEGILKAIYKPQSVVEEPYILPKNLERFFAGIDKNRNNSCYN